MRTSEPNRGKAGAVRPRPRRAADRAAHAPGGPPGQAGAGGPGIADAEPLAQDLQAHGEGSEPTGPGAGRGAGGWGVSPGTAVVGSAELLYDAVKGLVCAGAAAGRRVGGARAVILEDGRLGSHVSVGPDTGVRSLCQGPCWPRLAHVHGDSSMDSHMLRGTCLTMGTRLCLRATYVHVYISSHKPSWAHIQGQGLTL